MEYIRREGDKQYRKVNVHSDGVPAFQDFTTVGEKVSYGNEYVIEVLRSDGTTELFREGGALTVNYAFNGPDNILIDQQVPLLRVWMRSADCPAVSYQVPNVLPAATVGRCFEMKVIGGVQGIELFGDKYFEKVYFLTKKLN